MKVGGIMRILEAFILAPLVCLAADTGRLKTEVEPGRAGVFIDGKYVGPAANGPNKPLHAEAADTSASR